MLTTIAILILFMFFGINLLMMVLERKLSLSDFKMARMQLSEMLSKTHNPKEYFLARVYFWGSIVTLIILMVFMEVSYV
jgi:hypothetical protein